MLSHKVKAILFGSISIIIIGAIVIIALWPTSKSDNNSTHGDEGDDSDGNMSDSSRLNLVNLHYCITNHAIITTSSMVVFGCIIIIILFAKGYVSRQKRRKREKKARSRERHNSRDFTLTYSTNGTWHMMDQAWMPQQMPAPGWGPPGGQLQPPPQPPPGPLPQAAPRHQREDQPSQELALVHAPSGRTSNEDQPRLGSQWKPTN